MKNILDIVTQDGHDDQTDLAGSVFRTRTISEELMQAYTALIDTQNKRLRKWRYILPAEMICFLLWIGSDLFEWDELTLFFGILTIFGIPLLSVLMNLAARVKMKPLKKHGEDLEKRSMAELGVPEDAQEMELLRVSSRFTPIKNTKKRLNVFKNPFENFYIYVFEENNMLCLVDVFHRMEIPLVSLQNVSGDPQKGWVQQWIQKKSYRKFKKYGVRCHDSTNYSIRYYTVEIHDPLGNFFLCIPNYEMERFAAMTRIQIYEHQ